MNPEILEQRKDALFYNQNDLVATICEPLKTYFNLEWFTRAVFVSNTQEECVGCQVLTTNVGFFKSYLFQFNDNGKSFTQAIKETLH